jgi:hypothetical protein
VTRPKPLFGHGIPLNFSLPNEFSKEKTAKSDNTTRAKLTIAFNNTVRSLDFKSTYNSRNYPNDDILNLSVKFLLDYAQINDTEALL